MILALVLQLAIMTTPIEFVELKPNGVYLEINDSQYVSKV